MNSILVPYRSASIISDWHPQTCSPVCLLPQNPVTGSYRTGYWKPQLDCLKYLSLLEVPDICCSWPNQNREVSQLRASGSGADWEAILVSQKLRFLFPVQHNFAFRSPVLSVLACLCCCGAPSSSLYGRAVPLWQEVFLTVVPLSALVPKPLSQDIGNAAYRHGVRAWARTSVSSFGTGRTEEHIVKLAALG